MAQDEPVDKGRRNFLRELIKPKRHTPQAMPEDNTETDGLPPSPWTRKKFLGVTSTFLAGTAVGLQSCHVPAKSSQPAPDVSIHCDVGTFGLFYGSTTPDIRASMKGYDTVVVEPALTSAILAKSDIPNAMPYASIIAINQNNSSPALQALNSKIKAADGFLKEADGVTVQKDPYDASGDVWLVDLRNQAVYDAMKDYLINDLAANYPKGLFIDNIDTVSYVEQQEQAAHRSSSTTNTINPTQHIAGALKYEAMHPGAAHKQAADKLAGRNTYNGITDRAIALLREVRTALDGMDDPSNKTTGKKTLVVNGGFNQLYYPNDNPNDVYEQLVTFVDNFTKENIYKYPVYSPSGDLIDTKTWGDSDRAWLEKRMEAGAIARVAAGNKPMNFVGIEPCLPGTMNTILPGHRDTVFKETTKYYNDLLSKIADPAVDPKIGCNIHAPLFFSDLTLTNAADLTANTNEIGVGEGR